MKTIQTARHKMTGAIKAEYSRKQIATDFQYARKTNAATMKRFLENSSVERKGDSGRPMKITARGDQKIILEVKKDRLSTGNGLRLSSGRLHVSERSIRRRICECSKSIFCQKLTTPFISTRNRIKRLKFARDHLHGTKEDWSEGLSSDELVFV